MKIIIAGAYAIGTYLAKLLSRNDQDIVLIDEDEERLGNVSSDYDLMTVHASPTSVKALKDAGVGSADLFIGVTPDENMNMNSCIMAKALGAKKTVAKVNNYELIDPEPKAFLAKVGVDSLIYPENLAAYDIVNGLKMSWVRQRWDVHNGALIMLGIKLRETCEILNEPLKDLCKPESPYHIVAVKRGDDTIIPRGDDVLKIYDMAYFMTTRNYIPYIRKLVGKENYVDVKNVMVMGGGNTAIRAVQMIPEYMNTKIIEADEKRCEQINELVDTDKIMVINGDGRDIPLLVEEGVKNTQAFVALTGNAETNILACLTAKRLGVRKTIAMVENMDYVKMAESLDIGTIINKKAIAASRIYQMMLDSDVNNTRFLMSANADVAEFTAQQDSKVTKKRVFELGLPHGTTIGGLVRNGETQRIAPGIHGQVRVFAQENVQRRIAHRIGRKVRIGPMLGTIRLHARQDGLQKANGLGHLSLRGRDLNRLGFLGRLHLLRRDVRRFGVRDLRGEVEPRRGTGGKERDHCRHNDHPHQPQGRTVGGRNGLVRQCHSLNPRLRFRCRRRRCHHPCRTGRPGRPTQWHGSRCCTSSHGPKHRSSRRRNNSGCGNRCTERHPNRPYHPARGAAICG